ncbi:uncharacterized protein LOC116342879 isoform X1 [Contarinia nasturtii]|uniref:uncharacterized protein LOC116342879 isoform X1 n=1 Tax=Contarinia nasturtii TaxID=265458 RepID=UPI0012D3F830|nr:uncharacterized protein LOC116342879 isoform X1 [Contarinia nasturtii]
MHDSLFCLILPLIVVVQCETIHFTNSPSHLVGSKNITSYKLLVKNSDPITIIEANKEIKQRPYNRYPENYYPNDRVDVNVDDSVADSPIRDYHVKLMANMGGSHQLEHTNTQNVHGSVGFTITGGPSGPSGGMSTFNSNEFKKSDQDHDGESSNISAKKVVYSPILLKKFMKEYADKLKNADVSTKNEIQKIHEKIHEQLSNHGNKNTNENENSEPPLVFDKSIEEMEQKYNLNSYHDSYDDERNNRYKDRDGWVTLEAVPWSSSTVSKWRPHSHGMIEDTRRRPSANTARPYNNKPDKFPYHDDFDDDYYNRPKPGYVDRDRPGVYSAWTKPNSMNDNGRPRPQPYRFGESSSFGSQNKYNDRDHHSARPWNNVGGDLITDNRPSDFPPESHYNNHHHQDDDHFNTATSNFHASYEDRPSESNGEWVLISKTKGYQMTGGNRRQHGKRALSTSNTQSSVIVNVPQSMRVHKAIKLTVLPASDPAKNSTFSTDPKRKPTTIIHGGMLEIDATHQSIEDDVRATMQAQKTHSNGNNPVKQSSSSPASSENKNKTRKLLKVIATKDGPYKSAEILAAVGAGLLPATMAIIAPIVFGRKRRSVDNSTEFPYREYTPLYLEYNPISQPIFM